MSQDFNTQALKNVRDLSENSETEGFDLQAGQSWIYPTNYPIRTYQYNIVQEALFKNTLVSLPTGLGKTFIAAVVMYNFYRWYPQGKIIFMAPTRPLVKQQIDACYNIMAIPPECTIEITGAKLQALLRKEQWESKRVFFITPQVLENDLDTIPELGSSIKCLVFDEAHKAKGKYAYCEIIRKLSMKAKCFRVLALSATPGNGIKDVHEVMRNLLISHLEFRSEESKDVKEYVFERSLETVVVPLGDKIQQVKDEYFQILDRFSRPLINHRVITGSCSQWSKGRIIMAMKDYQLRFGGTRGPNYAEIMKSLNVCVTLYHGLELLIRHGLRSFLDYYKEHLNDSLLRGQFSLQQIVQNVENYIGPVLNLEILPDGTFNEVPANTKFGHPKFYRLRDILVSHFTEVVESSRVIVFFEYRHTAMEACAILLQAIPIIKPRIFLGQKGGFTQKTQIGVIKAFREGTCNTLLSTSIGEEGLDVGNVDLIVCFDIASKSPIRMIQRMGRTGRKREGRIIVLVTEGREQDTLKECLIYKNNLGTFVMNSEELSPWFYPDNPRMVPPELQPECLKVFITVPKAAKRIAASNMNLDDVEVVEIQERINKRRRFLYDLENSSEEVDLNGDFIDFSKNVEQQRILQFTSCVKHGKDTQMLVDLLQFGDSKRFNIANTQSAKWKQGDIRNMLFKPTNIPITQMDVPENENETYPPDFFAEISNYLNVTEYSRDQCIFCKSSECFIDDLKRDTINLNSWIHPDLSILDKITEQDFDNFIISLNPQDFNSVEDIFDAISFTQIENEIENQTKNESFRYEAPKSFEKMRDSFNICPINGTQSKNGNAKELLDFFHLGSLSEMFEEDVMDSDTTIICTPVLKVELGKKEELSPDLFGNSPDAESPILCSYQERMETSSKIEILTTPSKPNLAKLKLPFTSFESPFLIANKSDGKNIMNEGLKPEPNEINVCEYNIIQSSNPNKETTFNRDLEIDDICDLSSFGFTNEIIKKDQQIPDTKNLDINDLCDLSVFGLGHKLNENSTHISVTQIMNLAKSDCTPDRINSSTSKAKKTLSSGKKRSLKSNSGGKYRKLFDISLDSDDEFENLDKSPIIGQRRNIPKKNRKSNAFIDDEAVLSDDGEDVSADENSGEDYYEASFVADETVDFPNTQMQIEYLKTTRSPEVFKQPRQMKNISNIFSQIPDDTDNTYVNDSFCVDTEEVENSPEQFELSELDILENKLKEMRKKKRQAKKRRVILLSDDSD